MSNRKVVAGVVAAVFVASCLVSLPFIWVTVQPGHVGMVTTWGTISDHTLEAGGPYVVAPWRSVERVDVQTQRNDEEAVVPTKGGLSVKVKAVLQYRVDPAKVPDIYRTIGANFEKKVVDPIFHNVVRDACAEFDPEALYTHEREAVETLALKKVTAELTPRGFIVEKVMLQDPTLPQVVTDRIQAKVAAEQDAIRMQSVFKQREQEGLANKRQKELEAEAKVIEAKGIAESQTIIKKDLDQKYLVYQWIQAVKEAAQHGNKVIYIPTGNDGLPLFKNIDSLPAK